jgi:hypothetical protein
MNILKAMLGATALIASSVAFAQPVSIQTRQGGPAVSGFTPFCIADGSGTSCIPWLAINPTTHQVSHLDGPVKYATCNGVTDDTPGLTALATGMTSGTIYVRTSMTCLIDTTFTIPTNVTMEGSFGFAGSPGSNTYTPYGSLGSIRVNPAATIRTSSGSGLKSVLIIRKAMTFPAADSSLFAGVAVTVGGDDSFIDKSMILGFNKAWYSNGFNRNRIENHGKQRTS